jgi:hypothetical protein
MAPIPEDPRWKVFSAATPATEAEFLGTFARRRAADDSGSWLSEAPSPSFGGNTWWSPNSWLAIALFKRAIAGGPAVRVGAWEGNLVVPSSGMVDAIERIFQVRRVKIAGGDRRGNGNFVFASDTTMIDLDVRSKGQFADVQFVTVDESLVEKAAAFFNRCVVPDDPKRGNVYALAKGMQGYNVTRIGAAGSPIERGNYAPDTLRDYDHIVEELATESPCGRLMILSGVPGSGKTYLVRSLLGASPRSAFIVVPPHLVSDLGGPEILPALTNARSEYDGNVVLVIEDADEVLVQRDRGNMSSISSMLNLGDGILGSTLDIRILATTNAKTIEMDAATQRPGRLCRHLEVGALPATYATKALQRLVPGTTESFKDETTIAEVYQKARGLGWKAPPVDKGIVQRPELL